MITYRVDEKRVRTQLFHFGDAVMGRLKDEFETLSSKMLGQIKSAWAAAGKVKQGGMASSLRARVFSGRNSVWAYISAGGTKKSEQAHAIERGFTGAEQVAAHKRSFSWSKLGLTFPVAAYTRQVAIPEGGYMKAVLDANGADVEAAVARAIGGAIQEAGLG